MSATRNIPADALGQLYAERVLRDWPVEVQPVLRRAVLEKCIDAVKLYVEDERRAAVEPEAKAKREIRMCPPHEDPAMCEHIWEPHLYERGREYCPYCATMKPLAVSP